MDSEDASSRLPGRLKPRMYLVIVGDRYPFFCTDPRPHGCTYPVVEGADFIDLPPRDDHWKWGGSIPLDDVQDHVLARSKRSPLKFKALRSELDVPNSWEIVDGVAEVWSTWEAFSRTCRVNVLRQCV
jgi:hypothetical protein